MLLYFHHLTRSGQQLDLLLINHQQFAAVLFKLDYATRQDTLAEEIYLDRHQVLVLVVDCKEVLTVAKFVRDLGDLEPLELISRLESQLLIEDYD